MLLGTQNQGTSQTPENCKVTILNSEIFNCSSDGGGIFINGYNGGKINGGTLNLILNDKLRVTDNSSRYDYSIKNSRPSYHITFTDKTKVLESYISLQVGYELVFVTLIKKGLSPGENATFTFTPAKQINSDGEYEVAEGTEPYISVIFICKNNDQTVNGVVRKLLLPIGWWKIEETSWTWAYDSAEEDKEKYKNAIIIDNNTNKRLEFTNVRRTDVPATSESVVVNEMKSSIAEFTEE